jgi:hypothetical protein
MACDLQPESADPCRRIATTSTTGFIQQLAVSYIANGYWFYVVGTVPQDKNAESIDAKLVSRYGVAISKWSRYRRKQAGQANVQYIRHGKTFVLLATRGEHRFFEDEHVNIRDCRRVPIKVFGYAISYRRGHVCVRVEQGEFKRMKAAIIEKANRGWEGKTTPMDLVLSRYEPYKPVLRQARELERLWHRRMGTTPPSWRRIERSIVKPFE